MSLENDKTLITLWQQGNAFAFDVFYKRYVVQLVNMAAQKTGCRETAKELVQDVFMHIYEKKDEIEPANYLKAYLYGVLKNKVYNHYRQKMIGQKYEQHLLQNGVLSDNYTVEQLEHKELGQLLGLYVNQLPPKCQEVFKLSREEYLSHKEIAGRLNISINTVEQHMRKALSKLKGSLVHYLYMLLVISAVLISAPELLVF